MTTKVAGTRQVLVLCGSPRRDGNSAMLAGAFAEGAAAAGHQVHVETLDDHIRAFLRDCRQCRNHLRRFIVRQAIEGPVEPAPLDELLHRIKSRQMRQPLFQARRPAAESRHQGHDFDSTGELK